MTRPTTKLAPLPVPSTSLLVVLACIAVHAREVVDTGQLNQFDAAAIRTLLGDSELQPWLNQLGAMALLPVPRRPR